MVSGDEFYSRHAESFEDFFCAQIYVIYIFHHIR